MKVTIIGAAGTRTPLLLQALLHRQARLELQKVVLLDIDEERLKLLGALSAPLEARTRFSIVRTTDARAALAGADFVITTMRVGGMEARVVDERVPLAHGVLGQETTGPGGFAMAMRTIPVLLAYVEQMRELCPRAWLVNFANPSGMMAEALIRAGGWERTVGICDAPVAIQRAAAAACGVPPDEVDMDYFGLNHLGWVRALRYGGIDLLPRLLAMLRQVGNFPGLPFDTEFVVSLGLIPNEYLYYYYHSAEAVRHILETSQTRGEQLVALNARLFDELRRLSGDPAGMMAAYESYLQERSQSYMAAETGHGLEEVAPALLEALSTSGYANMALDLVEALAGIKPRVLVVNVPNRGALRAMADDDVVEIPAYAGPNFLRPLAVGDIPPACLGLMKQVKAYERLTIAAAVEGSYAKALEALVVHPLVRDHGAARAILDEYREKHGALFPALT